jgi:hypothetical protein
MGARSGDLVRARTSDRAAEVVEGILHLRLVPMLGYVQVNVGGHSVEPATVEVLECGALDPDTLDRGDPLIHDPGWRPVHDLDRAVAEGLVTPSRIRQGGTWADMFARLDTMIAPLINSGWARSDTDNEESAEYGDSVSCELRREDTAIWVELYEDGGIVVYPVSNEPDPDPDADTITEPLFICDEERELLAQFVAGNWVDEQFATAERPRLVVVEDRESEERHGRGK